MTYNFHWIISVLWNLGTFVQAVILYEPSGHHLVKKKKKKNSKNLKPNYSKMLRFDTFLGKI